jgi:hypothetical protein
MANVRTHKHTSRISKSTIKSRGETRSAWKHHANEKLIPKKNTREILDDIIRGVHRNRQRKQTLVDLAEHLMYKCIPFLVLLADYLQDGQIDGFGLLSNPITTDLLSYVI